MTTDLVKDHPPLAGVVMCCTSINPEERHTLATAAEEMGAIHKFDLTSDVTHLIIGNVDTPKYKYVAKERPDVKVVLPSFVEAVKNSWIEGGETDLQLIENEHRAPTLYGLKICLTGFEAQIARDGIRQTVTAHGGEFHGDLTKVVTHLIAAAPEGKKYEHGRRWGIKVVAIEWLHDAVKRGMILEEGLYDPILDPQDRGKNAWNRNATESIILGKRQREEAQAAEPAANRRKLRRTMSTKLETQQENIWADIASAGSGQARIEGLQAPEADSLLGVLPPQTASADTTPDPTIEAAQKASSLQVLKKDMALDQQGQSSFQGALVYMHGFNSTKTSILKDHLAAHGAKLVLDVASLTEDEKKAAHGFLIIPYDVPQAQLAPIPAAVSEWTPVTENWVESCMGCKRLVDPDTDPLCKPFAQHQVEGFKGMTICSTGFQSFDLLHLTRVVNLMGATYDEYLKPGISVLICCAAGFSKDKFDFAVEHGIETVNENWFYESIAQGVKQDFVDYPADSETPTVPVEYVPAKSKSKTTSGEGSKKSSLGVGRKLNLDFKAPLLDKRKPTSKLDEVVKVVKAVKAKRGPFIEEDDEDDMDMPAPPPRKATSQPLRELSQDQQNSSRKASLPSQPSQQLPELPQQDENIDSSTGATNLVTAVADTSQQHLKDAIASLLAQKQEAMKRGVSDSSTVETAEGKSRRKRGLLGRAASGSFASANMSATSQDQEEPGQAGGEGRELPMPSQKIIYEAEGTTWEEKQELIRKMGGSHMEEEQRLRVESIGIVRDASISISAGPGAGLRKRRTGGRK